MSLPASWCVNHAGRGYDPTIVVGSSMARRYHSSRRAARAQHFAFEHSPQVFAVAPQQVCAASGQSSSSRHAYVLQVSSQVTASPSAQQRSTPPQSSLPSHSAETPGHIEPASAHSAVSSLWLTQHCSESLHITPPQITPSPLPLPLGSA